MEFTVKTKIKASAKTIYTTWLSSEGHTHIHTKVPESGEHYIKGWDNHYFKPMKDYFSKKLF